MAADGDDGHPSCNIRCFLQGPGGVGQCAHAQEEQGMCIFTAGFIDDEADAFRRHVGGTGAFLAAQHRDTGPHRAGDAQGGLVAQLHGAGLGKVFRDDRFHDKLRAHQGVGNGEGIVRLAGGIRVDHDPDLFSVFHVKIQHDGFLRHVFESTPIIHALC